VDRLRRAAALAQSRFPVSIGPEEGRALHEWVLRERAARTLEVGLGWGVSALFVCEALAPGGRHVAIDPYQLAGLPEHRTRYEGAGLRALAEAGFGEVLELHVEESQIVLPRLLEEGRRFDFAFVDGNHRFEAVFLDLVYSARLLDERQVVFLDDVQLPGPRRALDFCLANLGWTLEEEGVEDEHEWAVARTGPTEAFRRPYDRLADF
jgi:predicted O-methyltransferase YrrM